MPKEEANKRKFVEYLEKIQETGFVVRVTHPVVYLEGLPKVKLWEIVYFESGHMGVVTSLLEREAEVMVLSNTAVPVGTQATRSDLIIKTPVGDNLLGNVVDGIGRPLYENKVISGLDEYRDIDIAPLGISNREKIREPLETGVTLVDFMIPLGKGQRELIIGDRNTGKTVFAIQSMLSQSKQGTICIYAGIGKKKHSIKYVEETLKKYGIMENSIIVGSSSSDPLGYIYFTPYTAMTIAEYFRDKGKNVLLILDDLTSHAKYYRELALVSKKFPGRDSYPGDVFYAHSKLLERAGNFKLDNGSIASISCLPIAETIEGDITGYIQTNLMSITDGHIFFDQSLYKEGKKPSINYFLSVTRVGRQTQSGVRWGVSRELSSFFYLHNKTERFIHFGAELNEGIKSTLEMGNRINQFFDQSVNEIYGIDIQLFIFVLIWSGILKGETEGKIRFYRAKAQKMYDKDIEFKKKIQNIIKSSDDLNSLLGKISVEYKGILQYLEDSQ